MHVKSCSFSWVINSINETFDGIGTFELNYIEELYIYIYIHTLRHVNIKEMFRDFV